MIKTQLFRKRTAVVIVALAIAIGATACLPDTGPPPTVDGYQRAMFDAVNQDRASAGLPQLTFSPKLSVLAGPHSCDMANGGGLFHTNLGALLGTPDYASFWSLGENVIVASSSTSAWDLERTWMGSAPHRANILNPNFNVVGMAACFAADGQVWATQEFGAL